LTTGQFHIIGVMFPRKWVKSRNHYCVNSPERTNPGKLHAFEKCDPTEGLPVAGRLYPGEAGTKQEIVYFDAEARNHTRRKARSTSLHASSGFL